ncbi:hypothetical protein L2E82_24706 [Cichorium intybus]|uniref:Uncharacterized protein n=1 Tax=Cichorium intybus TaxID=13427 RepID=A0ACB9E1N6_CICIN|nr:hypothetical protein L2E82_24706 [Cichorium intybus]
MTCPPGGENALVIYTTTLRGIRKTFEECNIVRGIIESHHVRMIEHDVSMDSGFKGELRILLGKKQVKVPIVLVKRRLIGGSDEVTKLEEEGKLRILLAGIPTVAVAVFKGCGGVNYIIEVEASVVIHSDNHKLYNFFMFISETLKGRQRMGYIEENITLDPRYKHVYMSDRSKRKKFDHNDPLALRDFVLGVDRPKYGFDIKQMEDLFSGKKLCCRTQPHSMELKNGKEFSIAIKDTKHVTNSQQYSRFLLNHTENSRFLQNIARIQYSTCLLSSHPNNIW